MRCVCIVLAIAGLASCQGVVEASGTNGELTTGEPLRVGTAGGIGAFAVPSISCHPLGAVNVSGGRRPDLIVATDRWYPALSLYHWTADDSHGMPIFSQPHPIEPPFDAAVEAPGYVLADASGQVFGFWLRSNRFTTARFDSEENRFEIVRQTTIEGLPRNPSRIAVRIVKGGRLEGVVAVPDGVAHRPGEHRAADYTPYDGAGIWRGGLPRDGIFRFSCAWPKLPKQVKATEILPSEHGGLLGINSLEWIEPRDVPAGQLLFGTKLGGMFYVPGAFDGAHASAGRRKLPVSDSQGRAVRQPTVGVFMAAYPSSSGERTDLIVGGEGGLYYHRFAGRLGARGEPVFDTPSSVLQESAELYSGSLLVPNVVDWNGDGRLDIVAGNAAGQLLFFENRGTNHRPAFQPATRIEAGGEPVSIRGGYRGSIQGPGEAHWGYTSPTVVDWNEDGLPDIVMNDIRGIHTVYLNRGTHTKPDLALPRELVVDSLEMHGTWRTRPAAGQMGDRLAYVTLDDDDQVRLYWRLDDFNLEDAGKLLLTDGSPIQANFLPVGGTGRAKFQLIDWDQDGKVDLLVGTPRHGTFPEPEKGVPWSMNHAGAAVLLLRNVGSNERPVYEYPAVMHVGGKPMHFGQHECAPVATTLGSDDGKSLNIIVGTERGRLIFFHGRDIEWQIVR